MRFLFVFIMLMFVTIDLGKVSGHANSRAISAEHAIVMDAQTGEVIFEKGAKEETEIASLTKVMTAIVALEQGKLADIVLTSKLAHQMTGSSIYLDENEAMSLEDLLYGLMLRSGNDAAVAIAEHIGGSVEGFTFLMNEKARYMQLHHTQFQNPHGLDEVGHYSSAYDMAQMMRYGMQNDHFRRIISSNKHLSPNRSYQWNNKNRLLTELYEYCTGGKTGFTKKAGRTLVTSAKQGDHEFIVVTLNAPDDWNDHIYLYEAAFMQVMETTGTYADQGNDQSFIRKWYHLFWAMFWGPVNG